MFPIKFKTHLL